MKQKTSKSSVNADLKVRFFLADDILQQIDGKMTLLGLYPDDTVITQMPLEAPEPTKENPVGFEGLAVLLCVQGLKGVHSISLGFDDSVLVGASMIRNAGGGPKMNADQTPFDFKNGEGTSNLITRLKPFVTSSFGKKTMVLKIDDEPHKFNFEIRRSTLS